MLHKLLPFITLGLLAGHLAQAQAPKPVSPEAAAQNRFQDIPVNLYTGTPGIGVPIYTFQEGANYFDREFGTGVNGYVPGRAAFFDRNSFVNGVRSPYINRRTGSPNFGDNPTRYRFRWYDPLIQVAGLLPLFVLFP
jgi:hypothetical protein